MMHTELRLSFQHFVRVRLHTQIFSEYNSSVYVNFGIVCDSICVTLLYICK